MFWFLLLLVLPAFDCLETGRPLPLLLSLVIGRFVFGSLVPLAKCDFLESWRVSTSAMMTFGGKCVFLISLINERLREKIQ